MLKTATVCLIVQATLVTLVSAQFKWFFDLLGFPGRSQPKQVVTELDEIYMNAPELITSKGYPCESHFVTTQDGYILELHRIPFGRHSKRLNGQRPVALLQHGLLGSSNAWVLNPADQSLPFLLADAGVDVWLGNNRGNSYSKRHATLSHRQRQFWDFSWDEMARYDLKAEINHIVSYTRSQQIFYIGYSQGSAIGFAKFSEDQEIAKKVKHFIALAPIAHVGYITSPLKNLVPFSREIKLFLDVFGGGAIDANPVLLKTLTSLMCTGFGERLCMQGLSFFLGDMDGKSINQSRVDLYNAQTVSSTSAKNLIQWGQAVKSNRFQHYDYGSVTNFWKYGQTTPPLYHLKNVKVPVALFTGGNDALADPTDVSWLLTQVNVTHHINVPWYNHLGTVLGCDAKDLIYPYLIPIITGKPWSPGLN